MGLGLVTGVLALTAAAAGAVYRLSPTAQIRRARRHYDRAITRVDQCLAARALAAKQQAEDDWELLETIWAFTLGLEEGSSQ